MAWIDRLRRSMYRSTRERPEWQFKCSYQFSDTKGFRYYNYNDDLDIPTTRMDAAQIAIKEIENRIDRDDLRYFIDNHDAIIFSDRKPEEKLRLITDHTRILKERMELLADPGQLMNLAAYFYIREDENPAVISESIHRDKIATFTSDREGDLAGFFAQAGLSSYLPLSGTSIESVNGQLKLAQKAHQKIKDMERELRAALS